MTTALFDSEGSGPSWQRIVAVQEPKLELRAIIVVHSLARGAGFGGVRRMTYASEAEGLADAKRLAETMSLKCAMAGLPAGGAKTVIFDNETLREDLDARIAAYEALGGVVESLGGDYVCGPDIGTGPDEVAALQRATRWCNPPGNDASRSTALGVLAGLRGLSRVVFGDEELGSRRYVIEGLGRVGTRVAAALLETGASVAGYDPDPAARARARELGVELLAADRVLTEPCDVFMPCAMGHTLTVGACAVAPWRAVCGAANNQLAEPAAGEVLHRRGIAWAPDFVVNVGAVLEGIETMVGSKQGARERVDRGLEAVADRCARLFERARDRGRRVDELADEIARALLTIG